MHSFIIVLVLLSIGKTGFANVERCDGGLKLPLLQVGKELASLSHSQCRNRKRHPCLNSKPTSECKFITQLWSKLKPKITTKAQCSAFDIHGNPCTGSWEASFMCACSNERTHINPSFKFLCVSNNQNTICRPKKNMNIKTVKNKALKIFKNLAFFYRAGELESVTSIEKGRNGLKGSAVTTLFCNIKMVTLASGIEDLGHECTVGLGSGLRITFDANLNPLKILYFEP